MPRKTKGKNLGTSCKFAMSFAKSKVLRVKETPEITEEEKGKWLSQCPSASQHNGDTREAEELPVLVVSFGHCFLIRKTESKKVIKGRKVSWTDATQL